MSLDMSKDYLLWDDPITVTLYSKAAGETHDGGTAVDNSFKGPVTREDVLINPALLTGASAVFHLWTAMLGGKVPKIGDQIGDPPALGGARWAVRRVEEMDRDGAGVQRRRCTCTKEVGR